MWPDEQRRAVLKELVSPTAGFVIAGKTSWKTVFHERVKGVFALNVLNLRG